ncbi:pyridoxal-phosphate dependent enzyme [Pannonibacter phragmitetus]|uniref:pyridoxal-phosphate dependent enzyme n=1 Tax=Pannonibacter phragmitetus TaxID=121719 RepID=UPI003D2F26DE
MVAGDNGTSGPIMLVTAAAIEAAYDRITPHIRVTPTLQLRSGDLDLPSGVSLKLESLQHSGSFKARGAFNTLLSKEIPAAGVTAASGETMAQRWPMPPAVSAFTPGFSCPSWPPLSKSQDPQLRRRLGNCGAHLCRSAGSLWRL